MRLTVPFAIVGTILSIAFGAGASVALSKSKLDASVARLDRLETDQVHSSLNEARMSQQLDDIVETVHRLERRLDK